MTQELNTIEAIHKKIKSVVGNDKFIFRGESKNYGKTTATSSLYRAHRENIKDDAILSRVNFTDIQRKMVDKARKHFSNDPTDLEILSEIQHYGGKTNLIDFSKNFLIALFFACDGNFKRHGRIICLNAEGYESDEDNEKLKIDIEDDKFKIENIEKGLLLEPRSKNNRVIFQSSIFIYNKNGFIE